MVVTFYQQNIVWGDAEANRRNVEKVLATAPRSDIFVVPETFTTGFGDHMAALAEVQWTAPSKKDYQQFLPRLDRLVQLYRKYGLTYGLHVWPELYKQNREVF